MMWIISFLLLIFNWPFPKQVITTAKMTVFLTELVPLSPLFLSHSVHPVITAKYTVLVFLKKHLFSTIKFFAS